MTVSSKRAGWSVLKLTDHHERQWQRTKSMGQFRVLVCLLKLSQHLIISVTRQPHDSSVIRVLLALCLYFRLIISTRLSSTSAFRSSHRAFAMLRISLLDTPRDMQPLFKQPRSEVLSRYLDKLRSSSFHKRSKLG